MEHGKRTGSAKRSAISPALSELLNIIGSQTSRIASTTDSLVAFRKNGQTSLAVKDLTIAFRQCFQTIQPLALHIKVFITDWLSDLVKSSNHTKAPTSVIQELSKVLNQLNLSRQETEEWMPLLISLCNLTDSCLGAIRKLTQSALAAFLEDRACMALADIVLGTGVRVFRHIDRTQVKRERSEGYLAWNKRTLDLTKNFQEFAGQQIQQTNELKEHAGNMTIGVCNMLLRYAEEARNEYVYLNLTFKFIGMLVPNCPENIAIRLEKQTAIRLMCESIHGTLLDVVRACEESTEVSGTYIKRHWTLAQFYLTHLRSLAKSLLKDVCQPGSEAMTCRGLLRYFLFSIRSQIVSSEVVKRNYPEVQTDLIKFVNAAEDIVVTVLFSSTTTTDDNHKRAVILEFAMSPGPHAAFSHGDPLSENDWCVGRLHFLLKTVTIFDEFSPALQLEFYPCRKNLGQESVLTRIIDSVNAMDVKDFIAGAIHGKEQEHSDVYFRVLSDLCTFACLVQPSQLAKLQVDMVGLVVGRSELWSLIAIDWWTCVSERLGSLFTRTQVAVLMDLITSLPIGKASMKVASLIGSILLLLDSESQAIVANNILAKLERSSEQPVYTLLSCFPYNCLRAPNLDMLIEKCMDGWKDACSLLLLGKERLLLESFYAMPQYVACLASIFSYGPRRMLISDELKQSLVGWSVEIVGGAHGLLNLIEDDNLAVIKISYAVECVVAFLTSMQPLQCPELIQVLETITSWENLPIEKQPLSRLSIANFLRSCSTVDIYDDAHMSTISALLGSLYDTVMKDSQWTVLHQGLQSITYFCEHTRYPQLANALMTKSVRDMVQHTQNLTTEGSTDLASCLKRYWQNYNVRKNSGQYQGFYNSTLGELKLYARTPASPQACINALVTATRMLETLNHSPQDGDAVFRMRLMTELTKLQKLVHGNLEG
ncbi:hypothetical protein BG011_007257 [Mortierella polycephala]|uniref:Uncharacterized protein n=1 Tax=Mortierella polycephala TaxID=41804 RepID=A0A9P6PSH6_9FUNG|nr:hypothetical protein BG011_007257 [Mortierella polycephala]